RGRRRRRGRGHRECPQLGGGEMALFSGEGWLFLLRWFHFLAGITWIGMLYYFNFVQTPFFATADSPVRTGMIAGSLVGRALWWFRWGAMLTFITGWLYILHRIGQLGLLGFFQTSYGWAIFIAIVPALVAATALVGTTGPGKKMLGTVSGTLWGGFVLAAILVILLKLIFP